MLRKRLFIIFFTITITVTLSTDSYLDKTVRGCIAESQRLAIKEMDYLKQDTPTQVIPQSVPSVIPKLTEIVYEREKRQRPFECITERTRGIPQKEVESSLEYQKLVSTCKREQFQPKCDSGYQYRSFDGTCNNLLNPKWGSSLTCMGRMMDANYAGAAGLRRSVCGSELPSPRDISLKLNKDVNRLNWDISNMLVYFGQFLAADLSDTPLFRVNEKRLDCCAGPQGKDKHPQCAEIHVSDAFYSGKNVSCLNIFRASICETCSVGTRLQVNQATAFVDLSQLYSIIDFISNKIRSNDGSGTLKIQKTEKSGDLLLAQTNVSTCGDARKKEYCFIAGDRRINIHTPFMSIHIVFTREHNRIATELKTLNPHWDEEKLYQEARKINIAQYQMITFGELIPLLIGPHLTSVYDLWVQKEGHTVYDPSVDATLFTEFAIAGYRLHSLVDNVVTDYESYANERSLRDMSLNASPLYHNILSSLLKGISLTPSQKYDRFFAVDITQLMYKTPISTFGFDISAFNILRGRDTGLPTYSEFVELLSGGSIEIERFDDLSVFMDRENIEELKKVYCDARDIDLWIGLQNERILEGGVVGPTTGHLIAYQMKHLKIGDRFYFEHWGNFNKEQLCSIRRTSLSGILCSNTNIRTLHQQVLRIPSEKNQLHQIRCEDIEKVDLSLWKEV